MDAMNISETLITYETAVLAKEKGFNVSEYNYSVSHNYFKNEKLVKGDSSHGSNCLYENIYDAPTQSLLQRWLREVHDIDCLVKLEIVDYFTEEMDQIYIKKYNYMIISNDGKSIQYSEKINGFTHYETYELALEEGLYNALNLIK